MEHNRENLGPAETIIQSLLAYSDHMTHNRPGVVVPDARSSVGVRWDPVTHKVGEDGTKTVYRLGKKVGRKSGPRVAIGTLNGDNTVRDGANVVGEYRKSGIFPEVALWFYRQVAEVWKMDNEFAARWASYAWRQEHRDLKVVLAAFLLVQSRKGDPVVEDGEHLFDDEDYRSVGEAMLLLQEKGKDFNPRMLLRVHDVLKLPEVAAINRELGFGKSAKHAFLGRWPKVVEKWLRYREENPKMLEGLVKAGLRTTVMDLARRIHYKPTSDKFFQILRWKQKQADDGRRDMAIGKDVEAAESWDGLSEAEICQRIETTRPGWKRIVGMLPNEIGVTRAIMAAAIESGALSDKELIILTPTIEDLGLLNVQEIKEKVEEAISKAEDMRARNIARNVRSKDVQDKLEAGADKAAQKVVEEAMKDLRVYVMVDISGSMHQSIERAKPLVAKLVQAIPMDRVHVAVFNTSGRVLQIKHQSMKGVQAAFRGINASGGTDYASGVRALEKFHPKPEEDVLFIFVGDEQAGTFKKAVEASGLNPMAFGFLKVVGAFGDHRRAVTETAAMLGVPCFDIDERTFEDDPYSVPRTIRALVSATPVGVRPGRPTRPRVTLVEQILQTELLQKPAWA